MVAGTALDDGDTNSSNELQELSGAGSEVTLSLGGGSLNISALAASDGSPADALIVDAAGNVVIGATTPASTLHISSPEDFGGLTLQVEDNLLHNGIRFLNSAGSYTWYIMREDIGSNLADMVFASGLNGDPSLLTERLRVGDNGTVTAAAFAGDGAAVTNVDAATLDGFDSTDFSLAGHTHGGTNEDIMIVDGDYVLAGREFAVQRKTNIGTAAVAGRNYGADTLILSEDNVRLLFEDSSVMAGFPTEDWRIQINDSSNGGDEYFAIQAATTGTTPFRIDNGAGNNALRVADGGVGIGTASPVLELHILDDNSPAVRLDQSGGAFGSYTWDVGGNEANYFVRNVSGGGLPFKIIPGANTNTLVLDAQGEVLINGGGTNAAADLHVISSATNANALLIQIDGTSAFTVTAGTPNSVNVDGDFNVANGTKNFIMDHPLHPDSMELAHNAVEGPGHFTFYKGRVQLDGSGGAWAELPEYFAALNRDWDYQLTAIGAAMPSLHVESEVANNRFRIAGGAPGKSVSWQITAVRNDAWAQDHPYAAERRKADRHQGRYYYPEGFGQPRAMAIGHIALPAETEAKELAEGVLDDGR